jgi:putative nucleotidyltransferase with HDIG domain
VAEGLLANMTKLRIYISIVITAALFLCLLQPWVSTALDPNMITGAIVLCALGILAERFSVNFAIAGRATSSSIAFIPLLAATISFPRPFAFAIAVAITTVAQFVLAKREFSRAAFNVAQMAVSTELAGLVFRSLGGVHGSVPSVTAINAIGLTFTLFFANQLFVTTAIAFAQQERVGPTFARIISAACGNLLYDVLISPIAIVVALLYDNYWVWGLAILIFPLLLIRHAYWTIQKLQRANKDILQVLIKTIETRDPYTSGHSLRVAELSKAIAEDLDLSPANVDRIHMAGLVHDIGKIEPIYAALLQKKGPLTPDEWRVIETHAAKGAEFLTTLSSFSPDLIAAVRHHHEKYDGTGYPDRISGETIPLASRIIMLCDSIDAMLSDRPYRRALSIDQVRAELIRCSGTQFDPKIVQTILSRNTLERALNLVGKTRNQEAPRLSIAV